MVKSYKTEQESPTAGRGSIKKLNIDDLKNAIKKALFKTDQENFLSPSVDEFNRLIEACIDFLLHLGYKVVEPAEYSFNVTKLDDLIKFFNGMLYNKHPEWAGGNVNWDRYRSTAKQFVEQRMKSSNLNREQAMKECVEIIKTIFDHEEEFKFNEPLSFGILGQKNCGWITDKAAHIINKKKMHEGDERHRALILSYDKSYEDEEVGFKDLDEILERVMQEDEKKGET
jgi:hypothetical protein